MHPQRGIRVTVWQWRQRPGLQDGAERREIEGRRAARALNGCVLNLTVAQDCELDEDVDAPARALILRPILANPLDHYRDVVWTTEVGDVEKRSRAGTAPSREPESLAAHLRHVRDRVALGDMRAAARSRPGFRIRRRLLDVR